MSRIVVELNDQEDSVADAAPLEGYDSGGGKKRGLKVFAIFVCVLALLAAGGVISGIFYWRNLKTTPQYSLALLVEAAQKRDQKTIDRIVDTDAVVEDFVPQVTEKAVELYGRGLPPRIIKRVSEVAAPAMPYVKERARAELPKMLRERTKRFERVPFFLMAAGAERYLDIDINGEIARVSDKSKKRTFQILMRKNGERWKIVAIKDGELAKRIAERIGQQIIALVKGNGKAAIDDLGRELGLKGLRSLIENAGDLINNK